MADKVENSRCLAGAGWALNKEYARVAFDYLFYGSMLRLVAFAHDQLKGFTCLNKGRFGIVDSWWGKLNG